MIVFVVLLLIQYAIATVLSVLNVRHLRRTAEQPPAEWAGELDFAQFPKMVAYTAAKSRLGHVSRLVGLAFNLAVLLPGTIAFVARWASALPVGPAWQGLVVLAAFAALSYLVDLPFDLAVQFGLEKRFGFSTISVKTSPAPSKNLICVSGSKGVSCWFIIISFAPFCSATSGISAAGVTLREEPTTKNTSAFWLW